MDAITVKRHGLRWAVCDDPGTAPIAEYDTCELAELAAKQMAQESGREVRVVADTGDEQLGRVDRPDVEDVDADAPPADAVDGRTSGAGSREDTPREPQAGL